MTRSTFALPVRLVAALAALLPLLSVAPALDSPARAQFLNTPGDNSPLNIQADSGIEWQQEAQVYIARGHAVAKRGTSELHADTLIAHYRPTKNTGTAAPTPQPGATTAANAASATGTVGTNTEIFRVEAEGNVHIKRDNQDATADRAVYDVDQAVVVLTGKNLKLTTATDIVTARDSLEWYDQKQVAVARGDAVATRGGKTIKADTLTTYMTKTQAAAGAAAAPGKAKVVPASTGKAATTAGKPPAKPGGPPGEESKISRVDAQGHVIVVNGPDTGRSDFGVYNAATGIATLVGNVTITRSKDVIRGQSAVMDLNNNVSRMLPNANVPGAAPQRVQGLFVREDAAARNGAAKSGAAATAGKPH